jgi:hypothetical protein
MMKKGISPEAPPMTKGGSLAASRLESMRHVRFGVILEMTRAGSDASRRNSRLWREQEEKNSPQIL